LEINPQSGFSATLLLNFKFLNILGEPTAGPFATSGIKVPVHPSRNNFRTSFPSSFNGYLEQNFDRFNSFKSYGKSWAENVPQGLVFIYSNDFSKLD
jgi:hypothetical protein